MESSGNALSIARMSFGLAFRVPTRSRCAVPRVLMAWLPEIEMARIHAEPTVAAVEHDTASRDAADEQLKRHTVRGLGAVVGHDEVAVARRGFGPSPEPAPARIVVAPDLGLEAVALMGSHGPDAGLPFHRWPSPELRF